MHGVLDTRQKLISEDKAIEDGSVKDFDCREIFTDKPLHGMTKLILPLNISTNTGRLAGRLRGEAFGSK